MKKTFKQHWNDQQIDEGLFSRAGDRAAGVWAGAKQLGQNVVNTFAGNSAANVSVKDTAQQKSYQSAINKFINNTKIAYNALLDDLNTIPEWQTKYPDYYNMMTTMANGIETLHTMKNGPTTSAQQTQAQPQPQTAETPAAAETQTFEPPVRRIKIEPPPIPRTGRKRLQVAATPGLSVSQALANQ